MPKYSTTLRIEDEAGSDEGKRIEDKEYIYEANSAEEASDMIDNLDSRRPSPPYFWLTKEIEDVN